MTWEWTWRSLLALLLEGEKRHSELQGQNGALQEEMQRLEEEMEQLKGQLEAEQGAVAAMRQQMEEMEAAKVTAMADHEQQQKAAMDQMQADLQAQNRPLLRGLHYSTYTMTSHWACLFWRHFPERWQAASENFARFSFMPTLWAL